MGCSPSKLDADDTVRRCKDRSRFMKEAVYARHHLAAAHSDYCRSLRMTGSALVTFAYGEPVSVPNHNPAVLRRAPAAAVTSFPSPAPSVHPPPPPPPFSPTPSNHHQKPPTPPSRRRPKPIKLPHILSDSSLSSSPPTINPNFIWANSTYASTPSQASSAWNWENFYPPPSPPDSDYFHQFDKLPKYETLIDHTIPHSNSNSNYSYQSTNNEETRDRTVPHQNGSIGNKFDNRASNYTSYSRNSAKIKRSQSLLDDLIPNSKYQSSVTNSRDRDFHHQNRSIIKKFNDRASNYSSYSRNSSKFQNSETNYNYNYQTTDIHNDDDNVRGRGFHHQNRSIGNDRASNYSSYSISSVKLHNPQYWGSEAESSAEREEVHCSEWGDHDNYSTTTSCSSKSDDDDEDEIEFNRRSDYEKNSSAAANLGKLNPKFSAKSEGRSATVGREYVGANLDRQIVVRHQNLVEIVSALKEHFDKAASAGDQVAEILESGRAHLDRGFKQLRKTIHHSSGILSNLSSTWTSKPPLMVKYRLELGPIEQCGGPRGLCSTLERLLAWEKKLYQEVKAREGVKFEHEKKLSVLQSQEYRGEAEAKLVKTKASIKRLQSLILVTSQAVSTTSVAIVGLRDSDLIPQLVELCHGLMYMWRSMNRSHEIQSNVVQQVRGLVAATAKGGASTSDVHRQATRDLEVAVSAWHSSFCRLIKFQRDFVHALYGWFKLSLLPVTTEPSKGHWDSSEALAFFDEWRLALDRVPDTVASEAINSFNNIIHSIFMKQTEEIKIKKRGEAAAKELEKKASSIRSIEKKYYNSYSLVGVGVPDDNVGHVLDTRDPLAEKKAELAIWQRRVEEEMVKHAKAVEVTKAMTLNNIQTGLPGVFHAMTSFSTLMTEALEAVCTRSYAIE